MALNKGDQVKVEYTGTLDDGTVFDSTEKQGNPLEFEIGGQQIIPGFEKAVVEMKPGEEKEVKIKSADAYGDRRDELTRKIPKDQLPKEQEPKEGMVLLMKLPNGQQLPAKITEIGDKEVTIDINHPLAGKDLNFKIKLLEVNPSEKSEKSDKAE